MAVIETTTGMLSDLARLLAGAPYQWLIGLYQPGFVPSIESVIDDVTPAVFGGYSGLATISAWSAPYLVDNRAVSDGPDCVWSHDGSVGSCWVAGYYIVDTGGVLLRAEPIRGDPVPLARAGQTITVRPRLSLGSRFLGGGS